MALGASHCIVCDAGLTLHQRASGRICGDWRCREAELDEALEAHRAEAAAALGIERPEDHVLFVVPRSERPVVPLPARRKVRFRTHLRRAAAAAARGAPESVPPPEGPTELATTELAAAGEDEAALPAAETGLLGRACAACRGYCCRHGRDHALLGGVHMARYLAAHPEGTPERAVGTYLAHLPDESFEGACVFQGRDGCTLPRGLRAELCNAYECGGLKAYRRALARYGPRPGCAVVREDNRILRSAFFDAEGLRRYEPEGGGAAPATAKGRRAKGA